jgi:hypothetical protein
MKDMNPGKKICSFLEKKLALFNKYLSITKRMKESLKGKEAGNPGVYISERQDCIKRIERIDLSMEKIIKASSDKRSDISYQFKIPTMPSYLHGVSYEPETLKGEEGLAHPPRLSESDAGHGGGERLIDSYISSIKSIMEKVDLIDKELMVMVKEEEESIKQELLKMRNVQQAARGYKKDIKYSPRFLDTVR